MCGLIPRGGISLRNLPKQNDHIIDFAGLTFKKSI